MEVVKEALLDDFNDWLSEEGKTEGNYRDLLDEFMEEKYATRVAEGNIFDQIKAMNSPPSFGGQECKGCSGVLQNLAACEKGKGETDHSSRKKRSNGGNFRSFRYGKYM